MGGGGPNLRRVGLLLCGLAGVGGMLSGLVLTFERSNVSGVSGVLIIVLGMAIYLPVVIWGVRNAMNDAPQK